MATLSTKVVFITTTGAGTFTIPSNFTTLVSVEAIGGGGGGQWTGSNYGGGGGGAGYSYTPGSQLQFVKAGTTAYYNVGAGGNGYGGNPGGDTWMNFVSNAAPTLVTQGVLANGGTGGNTDGGGTAAGGQASAGIGTIKYSGGSGAGPASGSGTSGSVGGGGGAAGPNGAGGNAGFGGNASGGSSGGGGGGANGGGNAVANATNVGGTGGTNRSGTGGGTGGNAAVGGAGSGGGGGGGGGRGYAGGAGSMDPVWTQTSDGATAGPGGGAGAGSGGVQGGVVPLYGAGAAGFNLSGDANIYGAQGIIVLTYLVSDTSFTSNSEPFERIFMTSTEFVDQFVGSSAWSWGSDTYGQLGNGTTTSRSSPGTIAGGGTNWKQVASGYATTAAIKTDGTLWTWGWNGYGQLGDGTIINKSSPGTTAGGGTNWKQVSSYVNTTAIKTDGTLWTWGWNLFGQLGDGTTSDKISPITTAGGGTNWKQVACGYRQVGAIKTDGTLWTWGNNDNGQLGDGTTTSRSSPATALGIVSTKTLYDTSNYQATMTVNTSGGTPTFTSNTPFSVVGGSMKGNGGYFYSSASSNYTLNGDFTLEYWFNSTDTGATFNDQFCLGSDYNLGIFVRLNSSDSIYMSNGTNYSNGYVNDLLSLCPVGTWNHLAFSRTGTTLKIFVNGTQRYSGTNTVTFNPGGTRIELFICTGDGRTFPGYISNFRIIKGTGLYSSAFTPSTTPLTAVPNTVFLFTGTPTYVTAGWKQVASGYNHTAAIKTDGTLWTWGWNGYGQLGDGTIINKSSPGTTAGSGTNWKQVACGYSETAAIKTDGTLWTWGYGSSGALGDGTTSSRTSPITTAGGGTNWKQVACGYKNATTAIKTDGTLWTWGYNNNGQLGDGTTVDKSSPIQPINNLTNWKQVSAGGFFIVAIAQN